MSWMQTQKPTFLSTKMIFILTDAYHSHRSANIQVTTLWVYSALKLRYSQPFPAFVCINLCSFGCISRNHKIAWHLNNYLNVHSSTLSRWTARSVQPKCPQDLTVLSCPDEINNLRHNQSPLPHTAGCFLLINLHPSQNDKIRSVGEELQLLST